MLSDRPDFFKFLFDFYFVPGTWFLVLFSHDFINNRNQPRIIRLRIEQF